MNEMNHIPIPPKIEPGQSQPAGSVKSTSSPPPAESFQDVMSRVRQVNDNVDKLAQASTTNVENLQQTFETASTLFDETMQAAQLINQLTNSVPPAESAQKKGDT